MPTAATPMATLPLREQSVARKAGAAALFLAWAILSYAAAFRSFGDGRDYLEYLAFYERIPVYLSASVQRFEPGFTLSAWFFQYVLHTSYGLFALSIVSISLGIKFFLFWKYLRHPVLASIYYCITFYPIHEYTQIRTAIALSFGYLSLHLAHERKFVPCAAFYILSVSFHTSAIFLLPVYFAAPYARRWFVVIVAVAITVFALGLSDSIRGIALNLFSGANPLLEAYAQNREMMEISIFSVNNICLLVAIFLGISAGWLKESQYHEIFTIISLAAVLSIIAFISAPMISQRMKEVFYVATVFVAHRSRLRLKTMPAIGLLWATGGLLFYLNLQSDVLGAS